MRSRGLRADFCPRSNQRQRRRIGRKRLPKREPGLLRDLAGKFQYALASASVLAGSGDEIMIVHLIDGTYELFRHFYGLRRFTKGEDRPFGAVIGVLHTVLQMIETGATHVGVATDHVIESFRNRLWSGYKTGRASSPHSSRNSIRSKKHSPLWVWLYGP